MTLYVLSGAPARSPRCVVYPATSTAPFPSSPTKVRRLPPLFFLSPFHTVNEHEDEGIVPVGSGPGITPLYRHLNSALRVPANKTYFTVLYANVSK